MANLPAERKGKDIKIPESLYEKISDYIDQGQAYNSVSDFAMVASLNDLDRISKVIGGRS
jgi:predicted membrane chloride channel (bestrophin family)